MSLKIQKYTDKSIVIRGNTKERLSDIKSISGAKFGYFGGEPGWMFPLTMEPQVRRTLNIPGTSYVDGPKPVQREGNHYLGNSSQSSQSQPSQSSQSQPSHQTPPVTLVKPPVRGALRGSKPVESDDDSDTEVKSTELKSTQSVAAESMITMSKSEYQAMFSKVNEELASLREQVITLTKRLDELVIVDEPVANEE